MFKKKNDNKNILLIGEKHYKTLSSEQNLVLLFSAKSLLIQFSTIFQLEHKVFHYEKYYKELLRAYKKGGVNENTEKNIVCFLKENNIGVILLGNDNKPLERLWVGCAKLANIPTVVYQHGIWAAKDIQPYQADGWVADYLFVYDEYHKNLIASLGMNPHKVKTVGFPCIEELPPNSRICGSVCIIGSAGFSSGLGDKLKKKNTEIAKVLLDSGYSVFYRPHPIEIKEDNIEVSVSGVSILSNQSYLECLSCYEVYIGFTSTMLIEASIYGAVSIQVADEDLNVIDFSEMNYAHTIKYENIASLKSNIKGGGAELKKVKVLSKGEMGRQLKKII